MNLWFNQKPQLTPARLVLKARKRKATKVNPWFNQKPQHTGEITAKGTQEEGHEGESLVQPELPEYTVAEATITETETVEVPYTREYVNDDTLLH